MENGQHLVTSDVPAVMPHFVAVDCRRQFATLLGKAVVRIAELPTLGVRRSSASGPERMTRSSGLATVPHPSRKHGRRGGRAITYRSRLRLVRRRGTGRRRKRRRGRRAGIGWEPGRRGSGIGVQRVHRGSVHNYLHPGLRTGGNKTRAERWCPPWWQIDGRPASHAAAPRPA